MFDGESNAQGMSDSAYARKRRELLVLAHDLKALGYVPQLAPHPQRDLTGCLFSARAADLDVPRLVVIGAQSGNTPGVCAGTLDAEQSSCSGKELACRGSDWSAP